MLIHVKICHIVPIICSQHNLIILTKVTISTIFLLFGFFMYIEVQDNKLERNEECLHTARISFVSKTFIDISVTPWLLQATEGSNTLCMFCHRHKRIYI